MNTLFILLRSSSDESSLVIKIIVGILALIVTSIIRANKKENKKKRTDAKTSSREPVEPVANNDQLDKIMENQSKIDKMKNTNDESIWEDDESKKQ